MNRLVSFSLACCVPVAGAAGEIADPADLDVVCSFAEPIGAAYPELIEGYELDETSAPTTVGVPTDQVVAALPPELLLDAPEPGGDRVLEVSRARQYARERTERIWDSYEVVVPSGAFAFWIYDEEAAAFNATVDGGVELFGGAYSLVPADEATLRFPVEPQHADNLETLHAMGSLDVRLRFTLAPREDPWAELCSESDEAILVPVRILEAVLAQAWESQPHATARTVAYASESLRSEPTVVEEPASAVPVVEVASIEVSGGCPPDDLTVLQTQMEGLLADCYTAGLRENASLDGTLTVQFELSSDGDVSEPQLRIDALVNRPASDCVLAALDRMQVRRRGDAPAGVVSALIRFVRTEQ